MAKKKASKPAMTVSVSTEFEYWVQKSKAALTFPVSPPPPPGTLPTAAPPPAAPSAHKFIKTNFDKVERSPFGAELPLPSVRPIREVEVICAAMSAGYGTQLQFSATSVLGGKPEKLALRRYLAFRLEMLVACFDYGGATVTPKSFFTHIETSEKAALSFIVGCIGTHIAARVWMSGGGTHMTRFLHSGIYTKSLSITPAALVKLTKHNNKGKIPDFLVQDRRRKWHAFESKGGVPENRWQQVVSGLRQLANVSTIKLAKAKGKAPAPETAVCVQTALSPGIPLSITLVDPPSEAVRKEDSTPPAPPNVLHLTLVPGVADLIASLDAIDWFHTLTDGAVDTTEIHREANLWSFKGSSAFQGLVLGLPRAFLSREDDLRRALAQYLAVQETLELLEVPLGGEEVPPSAAELPQDKKAFEDTLSRVRALSELSEPRQVVDGKLVSTYDAIQAALLNGANRPVGALHAWARCLHLAHIAGQLLRARRVAESDRVVMRLRNSGASSTVSEAGLYIETSGRRQASSANTESKS